MEQRVLALEAAVAGRPTSDQVTSDMDRYFGMITDLIEKQQTKTEVKKQFNSSLRSGQEERTRLTSSSFRTQ